MNFVLQPWQLLLAILAGWINRQQQEVIEYLRTENQILKEKLGKRRIVLSDDQRRRLAVKGKVLGRKVLESIGTLFTPDTILRWHRIGNRLIDAGTKVGCGAGEVHCRERLGGILRYYYRAAALRHSFSAGMPLGSRDRSSAELLDDRLTWQNRAF